MPKKNHSTGPNGIHTDGIGWNPQGYFCGTCYEKTCKGCSLARIEYKYTRHNKRLEQPLNQEVIEPMF